MQQILKLWGHLSSRRRKQFMLLLALMFASSIAEVVSIGAVIPFLGVLTSPEQLFEHAMIQPMIEWLQITKPNQLIFPITLAFVLAVLIAASVRLLLLFTMTRLTFSTGADLSINIYKRTLYQDYSVHIARNSSEVINGIIVKTNGVISGILNPSLMLMSSIILIISILIVLFSVDFWITLVASLSFGTLYALITLTTHKLVKHNSQCIAHQSTQMVKALQEGLGGIRDVLIDGTQQFYCKLYQSADSPLRRSASMNSFISNSPRYVMEAIGMTLIAILAYTINLREGNLLGMIPTLGAFVLGAQRLLPMLQQSYASYTTIKGNQSSFQDVLGFLDQLLPDYHNQFKAKKISFNKEIRLAHLDFRYSSDNSHVLKGVNLTLKKGSSTGFIGSTGSGKSTLIDVIMALLDPTEGQLYVDDERITRSNRRSWQMHIAHVPQNIYLSDSSIAENIAFGIPLEAINHKKVMRAAQQAKISGLIEGWPEQYKTVVGERGVRLSGGQRQRIGIARALYKDADVLIFDEATSALDNETERAVMDTIEKLKIDLTVLIIAHRLTTLKYCDKIIELSDGKILRTGNYKTIVEHKNII
jgi:ATP-binding cassette subfamily B protein